MMSARALSSRYADVIGKRFGLLTFQGLSAKRGDGGRVYGVFQCECRKTITLAVGRVLSGRRSDCGCRRNTRPHLTHGMRRSPEYSSWQSMKARCLDQWNKDYPRWGGRGVTVCDEWIKSFEAFYRHVGSRPKGTSIDRIDNRRGYEPGNVRWATASQQQRNRVTAYRWHIKGVVFETCEEAAQRYGVSKHTIWRWVNGQQDNRRNSFTPPREDCHVVSRY